MDIDKDLEQDIERAKKRAKWGCLSFAILLLGPIILFAIIFSYEMYVKESPLVVSHSPGNINTITVVEKGQAAWLGPSSVRIKYGWKHIDRSISNDGGILKPSNVAVSWKNGYEATITLYGDEQIPEIVKFHAEDSVPFKTGQFDLGSFTFKTSESPNLIHIIEFREVNKSKGPAPYSTVKIYYGKRSSVLKKFKEYEPTDIYTPDNFNVSWKNDGHAAIEVVRKNETGETYIEDAIEIELSK
ncbi:MAG: hypothetical protein ACE3JP_13555 [Ectobacillus sp.]